MCLYAFSYVTHLGAYTFICVIFRIFLLYVEQLPLWLLLQRTQRVLFFFPFMISTLRVSSFNGVWKETLLNSSNVLWGTSQHVFHLDTLVYMIILLPAIIHPANLQTYSHKWFHFQLDPLRHSSCGLSVLYGEAKCYFWHLLGLKSFSAEFNASTLGHFYISTW